MLMVHDHPLVVAPNFALEFCWAIVGNFFLIVHVFFLLIVHFAGARLRQQHGHSHRVRGGVWLATCPWILLCFAISPFCA